MKDPVIARIAMQASDLYADAYSTMLVGSVKNQWEKVTGGFELLILYYLRVHPKRAGFPQSPLSRHTSMGWPSTGWV